jgi:hypothetical protein
MTRAVLLFLSAAALAATLVSDAGAGTQQALR